MSYKELFACCRIASSSHLTKEGLLKSSLRESERTDLHVTYILAWQEEWATWIPYLLAPSNLSGCATSSSLGMQTECSSNCWVPYMADQGKVVRTQSCLPFFLPRSQCFS